MRTHLGTPQVRAAALPFSGLANWNAMGPSMSHSVWVAELGLPLGGGLHASSAPDHQLMLPVLRGMS